MRLSRPPVDPAWLAGQLAELERLADEGDTLEVVAKLRIVRDASPSASAAEPLGHRQLRARHRDAAVARHESLILPARRSAGRAARVGAWTPRGSSTG